MLRDAKNAGFLPQGMWFWKKYVFHDGKRALGIITPEDLARATEAQDSKAVQLQGDGSRQYWWFDGCFYWDDDGLTRKDVEALVHERRLRKQQ